VSLEFFIS